MDRTCGGGLAIESMDIPKSAASQERSWPRNSNGFTDDRDDWTSNPWWETLQAQRFQDVFGNAWTATLKAVHVHRCKTCTIIFTMLCHVVPPKLQCWHWPSPEQFHKAWTWSRFRRIWIRIWRWQPKRNWRIIESNHHYIASKAALVVVLMMISSKVDSVWILRCKRCKCSSESGSWCLPSEQRWRVFQVEELPPSVPSAQAQAEVEACRFSKSQKEPKWKIYIRPYPLYIHYIHWKGTILKTRINWDYVLRFKLITWSFILATCDLCDENMCLYILMF